MDREGAAEPAWVWQAHCHVGIWLCWVSGRLFSETELSHVHMVFPYFLISLGCKTTETQVFYALQFSANSLGSEFRVLAKERGEH